MKRYFLAILLLGLTGCMSGSPESVPVVCAGDCSNVNISMPNGNDLTLETDHHIIHISGLPESDYAYYVWTGDKTYSDAPDVKIESDDVYVIDNE